MLVGDLHVRILQAILFLIMSKLDVVLVLDSIRSIYNVGSLFRLADGMGLKTVYTVGITPHPKQPNDQRLPHVLKRVSQQIDKTALGAQESLSVIHEENTKELIKQLVDQDYLIVCLEQSPQATELTKIKKAPKNRLALVLGNEVHGISKEILSNADIVLEITMRGKKESLNVATAGAIALHHIVSNISTR
jgi:23S rRNA (guanosine2251-2'-O)-methyltransferase